MSSINIDTDNIEKVAGTTGLVGYSSSYISLQAVDGIYLNGIGPGNTASTDLPKEITDNKGNFYISGHNGKAIIKSKDTGSIHITSKLANVQLASKGDVLIESAQSTNINATTSINVTTSGECNVTVGSPQTMLNNALTNLESLVTKHTAGEIGAHVAETGLHGVLGANDIKNIATNIKSLKNLKSLKLTKGGIVREEAPVTGRVRSNAMTSTTSDAVATERTDAIAAKSAQTEEDITNSLEDLKGGALGLFGIAASFLTSYSTMAWGGFSNTAIGAGSTTIVGDASTTVLGANSITYIGSSTTSHLGDVNEVDLSVSIHAFGQKLKAGASKISNAATAVASYLVRAKDAGVETSEVDVKIEDTPVDLKSSGVCLADSDADINDCGISICM